MKSTATRNLVLDALLGAQAPSLPATLWAAIYTVAPDEDGGGTEVTGGSYARVSITNNLTNFPAAVAGLKSNATAIVFPAPTAIWGTALAWGLHDHATNDSLVLWGPLVDSTFIDNGDPAPQFGAGDLDFEEE